MIANLATQKPPITLKIGGKIYPVDVDYLTWIEITGLFDEFDFKAMQQPGYVLDEIDVKTLKRIEKLAFGGLIRESAGDVLAAVTTFACGYPQPHGEGSGLKAKRRVLDFEQDLNSIIIAIRDQSGIDLTEKGDTPFHWWRFLVEFHNLTGEHHICKLMELRAYDGDDKDMKRARDAVALPPKITHRAQKQEDEMAKLFYGC